MDRIAKAIVAGLIAGYAVFELATTGDSSAGEGVTSAEWIRIAASTVIAGLGTWAVPNSPDKTLRP